MNIARGLLVALAATVAACGGTPELECEDGSYKNAVRGKRLAVPEGLDQLETLKEMPIPAASPQAPREGADDRCLEMPPTVIGS